ncbi:anti-sigma factor family protein [Streptomyces mangrovisoli]|uniref:Zinc-finger domain-containing protein n=1 Tax=Streptomyces mangrovisoli TaxID=1428628 RepID=A0A1J4P449_9ACTN|nr:hypothetical protein [Streptomyces mangrovisoli]OIJ69336.1 hypothetical protein WN71_003595 [Streptomyces mangrovisoli]
MTSTTDAAGHPDVEEISDLTEGLLAPSRAVEVQGHLEACALCSDVHASLEEIRELLGDLPEPQPMPADVAERIDAALAAEALTPTTSEAHVSRETSLAADRPAGRAHGTPVPGGVSTGPGSTAGGGATTGPGRGRVRRRRRIALGTALTAAVLGAGALLVQSLGGSTGSGATDTFSHEKLQNQVADLLGTKSPSPSPSPSGDTKKPWGVQSDGDGATANTLIAPSPSVPDCVRKGINRTDTVLGAKKGTYQGDAAYLVVLPDATDTRRVTAYVVDAACAGKKPATPGKILLKRSYAKP